MTDIIERLRAFEDSLMREAADEIERLRRELAHASKSYDADIAEIKACHANIEWLRAKNRELALSLATLLTKKTDEIERLRAEIERLRMSILEITHEIP